jgi:hypothetical protein
VASPGSNTHRKQERRLRSVADDEIGRTDREVREEADRRADAEAGPSPAAQTDRAKGPLGER